jgi:hypothetical protein
MRKGLWRLLLAVGVVGLGGACKRGEQGVETERGRLGEEARVEQPALGEARTPEVLGGEDVAEQEIYGTVSALTPRSITIQGDETHGGPMSLEVNDSTRFVLRGQPASRGQLQEGTQVRTTFDELSGKYVADTVEIIPQGEPVPKGQ